MFIFPTPHAAAFRQHPSKTENRSQAPPSLPRQDNKGGASFVIVEKRSTPGMVLSIVAL